MAAGRVRIRYIWIYFFRKLKASAIFIPVFFQTGYPTCKEKPCRYPDDEDIPAIANGSLEINGRKISSGAPSPSSSSSSFSSSQADDAYGGMGERDGDSADGARGGGGGGGGGTYKPGAVAIYRCNSGETD